MSNARKTATVSTCVGSSVLRFRHEVFGLARTNATQVREFQNNRLAGL
jgi:hypothetical protein